MSQSSVATRSVSSCSLSQVSSEFQLPPASSTLASSMTMPSSKPLTGIYQALHHCPGLYQALPVLGCTTSMSWTVPSSTSLSCQALHQCHGLYQALHHSPGLYQALHCCPGLLYQIHYCLLNCSHHQMY